MIDSYYDFNFAALTEGEYHELYCVAIHAAEVIKLENVLSAEKVALRLSLDQWQKRFPLKDFSTGEIVKKAEIEE